MIFLNFLLKYLAYVNTVFDYSFCNENVTAAVEEHRQH